MSADLGLTASAFSLAAGLFYIGYCFSRSLEHAAGQVRRSDPDHADHEVMGCRRTAYAAPACAHDLTALLPAFVTACQFDPLRDEAIEYARRLAHAEVPTELHPYPETFHATNMVPDAAVAGRMRADLDAALHRMSDGR